MSTNEQYPGNANFPSLWLGGWESVNGNPAYHRLGQLYEKLRKDISENQ